MFERASHHMNPERNASAVARQSVIMWATTGARIPPHGFDGEYQGGILKELNWNPQDGYAGRTSREEQLTREQQALRALSSIEASLPAKPQALNSISCSQQP